jgi:hypothetical protein
MPDPTPLAEPTFMTVATAPDLAAANVLRGALEAEDIECFIPDEQTAGALWHLSGALGGVRIQVNTADEARARAVLDDLGEPSDRTDAAEEVSPADRAATRSLRIAVVGIFIWPLLHPYSLSLALRSLRDGAISPRGRRQARVAFGISVCSLAGFFLFLYMLLAG